MPHPRVFDDLLASFQAADTTRAGRLDDTAFASSIKRAVPQLSWGDVGGALASMGLEGVAGIDYEDFVAALRALAGTEGAASGRH